MNGDDAERRLLEWGRAHNLDTRNPFGMLKVTKRYPAVELTPEVELVVEQEEARP